MFYKHANGQTIIIIVAVNDLTLASSCRQLLTVCKHELQSEFEISNLGPIHWLLGVEVKQDRASCTLTLLQKAYVNSVIVRFRLEDALPVSTPMETGVQLVQAEDDAHIGSQVPYREIIRSLMYAAMAT